MRSIGISAACAQDDTDGGGGPSGGNEQKRQRRFCEVSNAARERTEPSRRRRQAATIKAEGHPVPTNKRGGLRRLPCAKGAVAEGDGGIVPFVCFYNSVNFTDNIRIQERKTRHTFFEVCRVLIGYVGQALFLILDDDNGIKRDAGGADAQKSYQNAQAGEQRICIHKIGYAVQTAGDKGDEKEENKVQGIGL